MDNFGDRQTREPETAVKGSLYSWQWHLASKFSELSNQINSISDGSEAISAIADAERARRCAQYADGLTFTVNGVDNEICAARDSLDEILEVLGEKFPELTKDFKRFRLIGAAKRSPVAESA